MLWISTASLLTPSLLSDLECLARLTTIFSAILPTATSLIRTPQPYDETVCFPRLTAGAAFTISNCKPINPPPLSSPGERPTTHHSPSTRRPLAVHSAGDAQKGREGRLSWGTVRIKPTVSLAAAPLFLLLSSSQCPITRRVLATSSDAMALGGKAPARQTVVIIGAIVVFIWYLTVFRGTESLTSTPVSQCLG